MQGQKKYLKNSQMSWGLNLVSQVAVSQEPCAPDDAQEKIHCQDRKGLDLQNWIPASAGMTECQNHRGFDLQEYDGKTVQQNTRC